MVSLRHIPQWDVTGRASVGDAVINDPLRRRRGRPRKAEAQVNQPGADQATPNHRESTGVKTTDVVFVLDRSSSMRGMTPAGELTRITINNFNEYADTVRANADKGGDTRLSLLSFNHHVTPHYWRQSVDKLVPLNEKTYVPDGNTAWYDALGQAIDYCAALPDANNPDHSFLIVTFTDGEENSSRHETSLSIRDKVERLQATNRWTFAVVGANIDLTKVAQTTGTPVGNTYRYTQSVSGTTDAGATLNAAAKQYFSARAQGMTSSDSFLADVTGGKLSDADQTVPPVTVPIDPSTGVPSWDPTQIVMPPPTTPVVLPPTTPLHQRTERTSQVTGAPSPLLESD